jgi:hypothetical protein
MAGGRSLDTGFRRDKKPMRAPVVYLRSNAEGSAMPTTELPPSKEKAHEIARKIANERPLKKHDKDAPDSNVSGGFNQKSHAEEDEAQHRKDDSATKGDGQ